MTCTVIPPFLLERLAENAGPELRGYALRTLELDSTRRTNRSTGPAGPRPAPQEVREPQRTIFDAQHTTTLPGVVARREDEPPTGDAPVDESYRWLGASFDLFSQVYGRNSIDDAGMPLHATVHYGQRYANAFWTGQRMVYGDGDGEVFGRFTKPIGITGHELTHGVVQYTAGLAYRGQTGALNESISDVFASLVKQFTHGVTAADADWIIGEGIFQPQIDGVGLRSLRAPGTAYDDPLIGTDPQPSTMDGYVETDRDNGGVHINSGIPNHAFYLTAVAIGGYAWERAGKVWYETLTGGTLPSGADFATFARATATTSERLYGTSSEEAAAVRHGWVEVGIEP